MVGKGEITTPIQKLEYRFEGCIRLREEVKKILRSERRIPFFDLFDRHDRNEDFFILVEALKLSTKNHLFILLPFFLSSRTARMSVNIDHLFLALVSFFHFLLFYSIFFHPFLSSSLSLDSESIDKTFSSNWNEAAVTRTIKKDAHIYTHIHIYIIDRYY